MPKKKTKGKTTKKSAGVKQSAGGHRTELSKESMTRRKD